jgi:RNA polymerase sigma-70 factor (ECF subfamily)
VPTGATSGPERAGAHAVTLHAGPAAGYARRVAAPPRGREGAPDEHRRLDPADLGDHLDRLFRAAWALCGSREDAEDLVQETYARVLARPRWLRRGSDDLGYLLRTMRNTFISRLRAERRRPAPLTLDDGLPEPEDERGAWRPEAALDVTLLFATIAGLDDLYRDVIVAVDVAGLSYAEAATALGAREATITSRLHRARGQVAAALDGKTR